MATIVHERKLATLIKTKTNRDFVTWFSHITARDVELVGGKNASLGEMIRELARVGIRVPDGFATTTDAYWTFLRHNGLHDFIRGRLDAFRDGTVPLADAGRDIRDRVRDARIPEQLARSIATAYAALCIETGEARASVAVRSSATAEDLPDASFAGQQDTCLNVRGEAAVLDAWRNCVASLFTDRAISYRELHEFDHLGAALSVGVQHMVRSDCGGAGVAFSIETESGFPHAAVISANWGLGESVVQGTADPDEYMVFKPLLTQPGCTPIVQKRRGPKERKVVYASESGGDTCTVATTDAERRSFVLRDDEIIQLARWAVDIEAHFECPMDIEWAKDGITGELWVVQARPETVQSRKDAGAIKCYALRGSGTPLVTGAAIGQAIVCGNVCRLDSPSEMDKFRDGAVLVTGMTDPDWVPIMQRAAAIVTDHGGRTSHAAIVSRELGLPAVVGTGDATAVLAEGADVTVCCANGDEGQVYAGSVPFDVEDISLDDTPDTRTRVMLNIGEPAAALRWWNLPSDGVGLARMEFIINNQIKIHPLALSRFDQLEDPEARRRIEELTAGYADRTAYFVDVLAQGIAKIAAAHHPNPVIVRMSDFKTNEYAELIGGRQFEPTEANPMIGWRGASRYYSDDYRDGFALECRAIRRARETLGFGNVIIMIPFCRTLDEADRTLRELAINGLERGVEGLQVYMMCEVPSNVILADQFATRFDGFSIGSNDLTQLVLGVDRDSARLASLFHESDEAVTTMIATVIAAAHRHGRPVGLCGQAPSDRPEFAEFLVRCGIDSISVTPDSFVRVKDHIERAERL
jgi:pyruvate,water dikinase